MRVTIIKLSRRSISILLAFLMLLSCLMVGTITANAYSYKSGRIYFDDTNTNWGSAYLVINYDNTSAWYEWKAMTAISGTKLFYLDVSGGATNVHRFFFTKSSHTNGNNCAPTSNYAGSFGWDFTGGNAYFKPSANNSSTVNGSYNANAINAINDYKVNLTAKVAISDDYGSTYTEQTSGSKGGKVTVKATYWSSATATSVTPANSNTSYTSITYENAVKTGTATWEYSDVDSEYEFVKWSETVGGTAVTSTSNWRVTGARTLYAHFKKKPYTVSVAAKTNGTVSTTGGTVSPASFTDQTPSSAANTITATPKTNYVFAGWTSASGNITFANSSNASTTFTSSGPDTIYGNFTQETLYPVTVKLDGSTSTTVNAGNATNPEITAADRSSEDYEFTSWTLTGNVQLVSGYSATDRTIKIKATGSGGTVTANFTHVDYVYFYAALQSNWGSNPVVTVDGNIVAPYAYLADYDNGDTPITLYSAANTDNTSRIGANSCYTYYVGIYRVAVAKIGKNISVFNSKQTGTNASNGYQGTVQSGNGYCYITYSSGSDNNSVYQLSPQKVTAVSTNTSRYDGDETVTISKTETVYGSTKTAGQDTFKWKYTVKNTSTNAETVISDWSATSGTVNFVPDNKGLASGTYKVIIYTKDDTTGKMLTSCESSNITIDATPTQSTINFSQSTSGAQYSFTGSYVYKGGSATAFTSGTKLRAGSEVTLTLTCNIGYKVGTTTKSASGLTAPTVTTTQTTSPTASRKAVVTITFTVPTATNTTSSSLTITHAADEIKKTITVVNGVTGATIETKQAGVASAATLSAPPTVTDYTFSSWTIPSTLTQSSGTTTTNGSIGVKLKSTSLSDATVTINYTETLHTITVQSDGNGNVKRGSTTVSGSTTSIGNITAVTLSANNNVGYEFKQWEITPASSGGATSCTVNGTQRALSGSKITIGSSSAPASTTFKFNGKATVKAVFQAVAISISANFPANNGYTLNSTTGNNVSVSKSSGHINDSYNIVVILADGYEVASITGTDQSTMPTPTVSGRTYTYAYTLTSGNNISATVTLQAKAPTLTDVYIKDKTKDSNSEWSGVSTYANGSTVQMYYLQPAMAKATTDTYSRIDYVTYKANGTTPKASETNKTSGTAVSVASDPDIIPTTEDGSVTYTFKVTARNAPAGVAEATTVNTYTINVTFNGTQKVCFRLKELTKYRIMNEDVEGNPYYKSNSGTQLSAYNTAASAVTSFTANYPAYNASASDKTAAEGIETAYNTAYTNLMLRANTTKIYVLTKYSNSSSNPINIKIWSKDNDSGFTSGAKGDFAHFKMMDYGNSHVLPASDGSHYNYFTLTYEGTHTYSGSTKYMYSFTYTGHIGFLIYRGQRTNASAIQSTTDSDASNYKIVSDVQKLNNNVYGEYYYNAYNTSQNSSPTAITAVLWEDWAIERNNNDRVVIDFNDDGTKTKTAAQIKTLLGITEKGSPVTAPGITVTNTQFKITGPIGKANSQEYNMLTSGQTFPADKQGKYTVTYTSRFGYKADNSAITATNTFTFWVACDDIDIYVDMNDNVGDPILNFKYFVDGNGDPAASGTTAYLPYEMELVTGSESIYKYTIKISNLRDRYLIDTSSVIKIEYITVENEKIGSTTGGFSLSPVEAKITGEAWLKADSTKLSTFQIISYGSGTRGFMAVDENGDFLSGAIKSAKGTGIITDDEEDGPNDSTGELYKTQYAAKYTIEGQNAPIYNFGDSLNVKLNEEITSGGNTYYFDKWVKINKNCDELISDFSLTNATDFSSKADLNFTSAPVYGSSDGDATYVAKYKMATSGDSTVRVVVTYNFKDYDTSDGNYVYDANKKKNDASYTKTIKINLGTLDVATNRTYANFGDVNDLTAINAIVSAAGYAPVIKSNYFDYAYTPNSAEIVSADASKSKIVVNASFTETARTYRIVVKNGSDIISNTTGNYQQTKEITTSVANPVWKDNKTGKVIGTGSTYTARYVSSGNDSNNGTDCQVINVVNDSSVSVNNTSVITNSYTEQYYDGTSKRLRHNFYIVDYCDEGKLVGGGVLYATTDGTNYRQTGVSANLDTAAHRHDFIDGILAGDYATEYKAQTINNVGFRYKPYNSKEDVYRYSDELHAYQYIYETSNANSENYNGQKLRVFSFMVYEDNNSNCVVVPSEGYAEVSRYIAE